MSKTSQATTTEQVREVPAPAAATQRKTTRSRKAPAKGSIGAAGEEGSKAVRLVLEQLFRSELSMLTAATQPNGKAWADGMGELPDPNLPRSFDAYFGTLTGGSKQSRAGSQVILDEEVFKTRGRKKIMLAWNTDSYERAIFHGLPALMLVCCLSGDRGEYWAALLSRAGYAGVLDGRTQKPKRMRPTPNGFDHGTRSAAAWSRAKVLAVEFTRKFGPFPEHAAIERQESGKGHRVRSQHSAYVEVRCGVEGCDGGGNFFRSQWAVQLARKGGPEAMSLCDHSAKPSSKVPGYFIQKCIGTEQEEAPFPLSEHKGRMAALKARADAKRAEHKAQLARARAGFEAEAANASE
jgi:hypothetical protein